MRITLIDDNAQLSKSIKKFFEKRGEIVTLYSSRGAFMKDADITADVYIIDIALGDGNGLDITRYLRNIKHVNSPILMISGHQGLKTKLEGFEMGADDYIVKPFSPLELDARVKSILGRTQQKSPESQDELVYKNILFDPQTRKLTKAGKEIALSKKEKQITELFLKNKGALISKEFLISSIWGKKHDLDHVQNTINVSLCKVRKKLGAKFNLITINSEGYILED